jgi:hypothetical protein
MLEWLQANYWLFLAGSSGGLASFLYACKRGTIKNDKHCRKALLELVGGSVVGFFLVLPLPYGNGVKASLAFAGGLGWAGVIQTARKKITDVAEAAFGLKRKEGEDQ